MILAGLVLPLCALTAVVVAQQPPDKERRLRELLNMPVIYIAPAIAFMKTNLEK